MRKENMELEAEREHDWTEITFIFSGNQNQCKSYQNRNFNMKKLNENQEYKVFKCQKQGWRLCHLCLKLGNFVEHCTFVFKECECSLCLRNFIVSTEKVVVYCLLSFWFFKQKTIYKVIFLKIWHLLVNIYYLNGSQ